MTRATFLIVAVLAIALSLGIAFSLFVSHKRAISYDSVASSSPNLIGMSLFSDGEFGFTVQYPQEFLTDYTFATYYHLSANWRANALAEGTGTPIISITSFRTKSDHAYPRYYDAEVRIGASHDPKELARCLVPATEQNEHQVADVRLGGTSFKAFSFESAGMMQYLRGVSYRTVHDGSCIAIEQLAAGSSYREDPPSNQDMTDTALAAKYAELAKVVDTFTFIDAAP